MKTKYLFDPEIKHHLIIGLGVAFWVFAFLFFTEPLDVSELNHSEKLTYLPLYALVGAFSYCSFTQTDLIYVGFIQYIIASLECKYDNDDVFE